MKRKIPETFVLPAMLTLLIIPALFAQEQPRIKRVSAHATVSLAGADLFREYCAVCHGTDAKGTGPAAAALKTKPADLTLISRKNGERYPEIRVQRIIEGEDEMSAHGTRDMPIWGKIFRQMSSNQDLGAVRVYNLVKYIEQIQAK